MTKPFMLMLAAALALGVSLGGAFVGGVALGKSQRVESAQQAPPQSSLAASAQRSPGQAGQPSQASQATQASPAGQTDGANSSFQPGLTGTVESVEGNILQLNTPQGKVQATITAGTTVQKFTESGVTELKVGTRVSVMGQPDENGSIAARSVLILPEGDSAPPGGGFRRTGPGRNSN